MNEQFRASFVRLWGTGDVVVGAGVLIGRRHVLTCAHVVAQALNVGEDAPERPAGRVMVDFPLCRRRTAPQSASVEHWTPVRPDQEGDIAGLRLDEDPPDDAQPATLISTAEPWGHPFQTFGFANGPAGDWASGLLQDVQALRWLQVESATGRRVQKGYSGAPVWVDDLHGVVGIVVAADQTAADRVAYVIPTSVLVEDWPALLSERAVAPCPYRGLAAFREADSELFFGREDVISRLLSAVDRKSLVAVVGPSGSGKSSVVQAGLAARLRQSAGWTVVRCRPRKDAFEELAAALLPELEPGIGKLDLLLRVPALAGLIRDGRLDMIMQQVLADSPDRSALIIVDQFEELYTQSAEPQTAQQFVAQLLRLGALARHGQLKATTVITLRADFLGQALTLRDFASALRDAIEPIGPMSRDELRAAIERPAAIAGARFQDGLVDRMLDAVEGEAGGLPMLEFALTLLWDKQANGRLSHEAYDRVGGVRGALSQHADLVYQRFTEAEQHQVRRVFVQLVSPGEGTEDSRRLAIPEDVNPQDWPIVQRLADERLVVTSAGPGGEQVAEVAHEALILQWEQLRRWMTADREFRLWQERVRSAIRLWRARERDQAVLLRGSLLVEAETWLAERPDDIVPEERDFVQRSRDRQEEDDARYRRLYEQALSKQLVAQAELSRSHRPNFLPLSMLLLVESLRRAPSFEADYALRRAIALSPTEGMRLAHDGEVRAVTLSPDGHLVLSGSDDDTARLWDAAWGTQLAELRHGERGWVRAVAFSPDCTMAVTAGADQAARVWRVRDGSELKCLAHDEGVRAAAFHPSGAWVATGGDDGTARIWETTSWREIITRKYEGWVRIIAFSADGRLLLAGGGDGTVRIVRVSDWAEVARLEHGRPVRTALFDTSGQRVVTSDEAGLVRIWRSEGGGPQISLPHGAPVNAATFDREGAHLATACDDSRARLWDAHAGTELIRFPHQGPVRAVVFAADGTRLVTGSDDGTARIWDTAGTELARVSHDGAVRAVAISLDGNRIATASQDGTAGVWGTTAMAELRQLSQRSRITALAFSADGARLAGATDTGSVQVWKVATGEEIVRIDHGEAVRMVAFGSGDGDRLATAGDDGRARVWDSGTGIEQTGAVHDDAVVAGAFSQDGARLAVAGDDGITRIWRLQPDVEELGRVEQASALRAVAFTADGAALFIAAEDGVRVWAETAGMQYVLRVAHDAWPGAVALDPVGGRVAAVGIRNTVLVYDVEAGDVRARLEHESWVRALVFDSTGRRLATSSEDAMVRVWDAATGAELCRLEHSSWVGALAFSPDASLLATGDDAGTIGIWPLRIEDLIAQACSRLTRNLGVEEWRRFLGDEPYRETCGGGRS
jgi:WD40 repeat protein/energy-coupling factor transporter ATP-binding protein EcfA2